MEEVSNKAIAVLVVLSIAVSAVGMVLAVNKMSDLPKITGFASSQGTGVTNVSVRERTFITLTDAFINLGSLDPGQSNNSDVVNDFFTVQNDGSRSINVSVYDAAGPFSGAGCSSTPNYCYEAKGATTESGTAYTAYREVQANSSSAYVVISSLSHVNTVDSATIGVNVTVPTDESAGAKTTSMTVLATAG